MRATTSGWEIVCSAPIGSGTFCQASRRSAAGTNRSRGHGGDGLQDTLIVDLRAQLGEQPVPPAVHAITPPAARTSASARSESPASTSTPRTAVWSTVTWKPARSASSAVFLTQ